MRLAISCPIFEREWIFDRWADSVEAQTWPKGTEVQMAFVYSPGEDDTLGAIQRRFPDALVETARDKRTFTNKERTDKDRYEALADHRNLLLELVAFSSADYLLSWDSDLIFEPVLHKLFINKPVVGALIDMTGEDWLMDQGMGFPSWMVLFRRGADWRGERPAGWMPEDESGPFKVGVVMGAVLISRDVIESEARYGYHAQGEDIFFGISCEEHGFERWLVPEARGEHVFHKPGEREE